MRLVDTQTGQLLVPNVTVAKTYKQRLVGLLGSSNLADGEALCFHSCNSVHMFGMRYPIDVIYLDKESKITKLVEALKPWRVSFAQSAATTIEVQAGLCNRLNLKQGQQLSIEV